jgi:cytoskeletal protein CcmA (bactofilin family)
LIDVRGQLHNTIVSEKSLIVRATGKIVGKIHYAEIEIEKGGEIEGALNQGAEPSGSAVQAGSSPFQARPAGT